MKLIVNPKTKKQEKAIKTFLEDMDIEFSKVEEEAAVYKTTAKKTVTPKEKKIAGSFNKPKAKIVPEWQKQEVRKRIKKYDKHPELLIDEKTALKMIKAM